MKPEAAPGGHLDAGDFYRFIEKSLNRSRLQEVESHLASCAECVEDLALVMEAAEPGSAGEEMALAKIPGASPTEALQKLKGRIVASAPGPSTQKRLAWRRMLPPAAALAAAAALIAGVNAWVIAPARGRGLAQRALADLVESRQRTGRHPLRYVRGFERARVTRSTFDAADPNEEKSLREKLERARRLAPAAAEPLVAQGLFELDRSELDDAEKHLRAALEIDPHSVDARNGLAVLCYLRHQRGETGMWLQQGLEHVERARQESPDDLQLSYNLGMFYRAQGRRPEALRAFQLYIKADPQSEWGRLAKEYVAELEP